MTKRNVFFCLVCLAVLLIWCQSCLPRQLSAQESGWVTELLSRLLGITDIPEHFVRKLAHFTEYALLGCLIFLLMRCIPVKSGWRELYGAVLAIVVALLDETIQIFSGRGPMIQDVWLDFGGAVCGGAVTGLIAYLVDKKRST